MKGTLLLLCFVVLLGCGPDVGPTNPEDKVKVLANEIDKPGDLLPLKSGNAWTYTVRSTAQNQQGASRQSSGNPTLKVIRVSGANSTIALIESNKVISELEFVSGANSVSQQSVKAMGGPRRPFSPAIPLFHWPMKAGDKREWKGTGYRPAFGDTGPIRATLEYKGESEVDTPAGRMRGHRFDTTTKYTKNSKEFGSTQSVWLVPKVGIVRSIDLTSTPTAVVETEMKLQSYTVK